MAGALVVALACDSDDSAQQTAAGGSSSAAPTAFADAGALRGEGFEPTPSFDITNPRRSVPPRSQIVEGVNNLNGSGGSINVGTERDGGTLDAGADAGETP